MGNTHEVAVRPDGKELYVTGAESPILVVDLNSEEYSILGEIKLPGRRAGSLAEMHHVSFSADSAYAYISRPIQREFDASYDYSVDRFGDFNKIIEINTTTRQISRQISLPSPFMPTTTAVPSHDRKWLYFTAIDSTNNRFGVGKLNLQTEKMEDFLLLDAVNYVTISRDGRRLYATQGSGFGGGKSKTNLFSMIDVESFKVMSFVGVGEGPRFVALTPDESKAYVSNLWSNNVSVIDVKTMKIVATVDAGLSEPRKIAIASNGDKAYVVYPGTRAASATYGPGMTVAVFDIEKDIVLAKIKVHGDPQSIAIDPKGTRAFVSDGNSNGRNPSEVHIIDTVNDTYLKPLILRAPAKIQPTAIDITPDGQRLFVASEGTGDLLVIDTSEGSVTDRYNIKPRGVKVGRDGIKIYVFSPQRLLIIDGKSLDVKKTIDLSDVYAPTPWEQEAFRIILNRAEDTAYLLGDTNEVVAVNLIEGGVIARIPFAGGIIHHSRGLALTPDETRLFVSDYYSQTVAIIDTSNNSVITQVKVGNKPSEIIISEDGKRAYVLQQGGTTALSVIDINALTVIKTLSFGAALGASLDFELSSDERYAYILHYDPDFLMVYDLNTQHNIKSIDTGLDPFNTVLSPDKRLVYVTNLTTDDISVVDTASNSIVKTIKLGN